MVCLLTVLVLCPTLLKVRLQLVPFVFCCLSWRGLGVWGGWRCGGIGCVLIGGYYSVIYGVACLYIVIV
jgi:hypothetical protein